MTDLERRVHRLEVAVAAVVGTPSLGVADDASGELAAAVEGIPATQGAAVLRLLAYIKQSEMLGDLLTIFAQHPITIRAATAIIDRFESLDIVSSLEIAAGRFADGPPIQIIIDTAAQD